MKVALIMHNLVSKGGGPRQMLELGVTLQRMGHTVTVCAYHYNPEETYTELCSQLEVRCVQRGGTLMDQLPTQRNRRSVFRFLNDAFRHVRTECFIKPHQLAGLLTEEYDVINIHEWPANWAAFFLKHRWHTRIVWMCDDFWDFPRRKPGQSAGIHFLTLLRQVYLNPLRWFDRIATRRIDHIAVLSHFVERLVRPYYHRPTSVVRSGVDVAQLDALREPTARAEILRFHKLPSSSFLLLCNSIYFPHRRFEDAIDAVAALHQRYPDIMLIIVGATALDPVYAAATRSRIDALGLRTHIIEVNDFVPDRELYRYYQACDVFVFPNSPQTWGLAPFEAMALGKPVVVSRGAGASEVLRDGETALLYKAYDVDGLARAIEMLHNDASLRETIARRGAAYVRQRNTWERYAEQMLTLYTRT